MSESAYKEAGVDIEEAANLIERIKPHIAKTKRSGVMSGLGGFGALFDLKETGYQDPVLVSATDGVGTKLKIAIETGKHDTIGIDAVAMCVNDLVVQGAEPLFFLDYFATGKLDNDIAERVIAGIAKGCEEAGCALIGGETAEMPGMYQDGDYDIAGFTVGAVERARIVTGERIRPGDVLLGLSSSGLHSNGFSLVRKLIGDAQGHDYGSEASFAKGKTLGDVLLEPTRIYVKPLLDALQHTDEQGFPVIRGMAHITGGGLYENIPRMLPEGVCAYLDASSWDLPPIFKFMKDIGNLKQEDMALTLNCGLGMVIACAPECAALLQQSFENSNETVRIIGNVQEKQSDSECLAINNMASAWAS